MRPWVLTRMVCLALIAAAPAARAEQVDDATRSAARELGNEGVEAFQRGDYETAVTKLERAYAVLKVPSLGLWSARALAARGRLIEASERYVQVTRLDASSGDVAVQRQSQADAASELEALRPRIPNVVIQLEGAEPSEVSVTLDGTAVPAALIGERRPVNPGRHRVEATRQGVPAHAEITLAEGKTETVMLKFGGATPSSEQGDGAQGSSPAAGSSPSSTRRTLAWIALGVGGAGLALGGITGAMALGRQSEIEDSDQCRDFHCLPPMQDTVDGYNSLRTISAIGFIAGGALAAGGVVLLLTSPSGEKQTSALVVSPRSVSFTRSF